MYSSLLVGKRHITASGVDVTLPWYLSDYPILRAYVRFCTSIFWVHKNQHKKTWGNKSRYRYSSFCQLLIEFNILMSHTWFTQVTTYPVSTKRCCTNILYASSQLADHLFAFCWMTNYSSEKDSRIQRNGIMIRSCQISRKEISELTIKQKSDALCPEDSITRVKFMWAVNPKVPHYNQILTI